jgi:GrpB-like predicted nucleotidyltransferase (UPF0157 family)
MWKRFGTDDDRIELVEYNPQWPAVFQAESERIRAACGPALAAVEHIGSTALPGVAAKPVLDLMLGVERLEDADELVAPMRGLGYEYAGRYEAFGRFSFVLREHGRRVSHAHGFVVNGRHWRRHLFFRDHLRTHPAAAARYEALKRKLAARHEDDREAYSDGKAPFLRSIEALAR